MRKQGDIYYHRFAGTGRPYIIQKVHDDGSCDLLNLDDEGKVMLTEQQMDDFDLGDME